MADILVRLPYDPTGRSPDNLISGEPHILRPVTGSPYKIITMVNGGFYIKNLRVYDQDYNRLVLGTDYILTYFYRARSAAVGMDICSAIVFLDPNRSGTVYVTAQMVGGDVAFSLTVIPDYVEWFNKQPAGYVPRELDYAGNEPTWLPGELDQERWHLDTFQPFNNEIYYMSRAIQGATGNYESDYRAKVRAYHQNFMGTFTDRLERHIKDTNNPHVDTKTQIGLGAVANLTVATPSQARQAASNDLYLTPALGYEVVNELAIKPTNAHIDDRNNPHRTTPATISAPTKEVVAAELAKKYDRNERVVNSTYILNAGGADRSNNQLVDEARTNIPAANFIAQGGNYLNPSRLGYGFPNANTVLRNDGQWVPWDVIVANAGVSGTPDIYVMPIDPNTNYVNAFNQAMTIPWGWTAPIGSMILYMLNITYVWATGGIHRITHPVIYGAIKTNSGWVNMVTP